MLIDADLLIQHQLNATEPHTLTFADGRSTPITPVRQTPRLDVPDRTLWLDGTWQVTRWPFKAKVERLVAPATKDRRWESVQQPGKVFYFDPEKTSGAYPNYNRVGLDHIHPEDGAVMRRTVRIPRQWRNKQIFLRFDSIYPAGRVYFDGVFLGEHTSGLTPAEYDVTALARPGREAVVAVRLLRTHEFVKMDMPRHAAEFAGLAQPACLFAVDPLHIADFFLPAELLPGLKRGRIAGQVQLRNAGRLTKTAALSLTLFDPRGKRVASASARLSLDSGETRAATLELSLRNPLRWNDEFPNLYRATLTLRVRAQADQTVSWRGGFRRLDLKGGRPLLNESFIKFRGVNHLTYHPEHGLYTPEPWLRQCLMLMKKANVNAIRTHYLGPRILADLCDELGIYLLQELPIDWGTNYIHDPRWTGPAMQRLMGGVLRDRHHPSLVVWSVGNENMPERDAVADDVTTTSAPTTDSSSSSTPRAPRCSRRRGRPTGSAASSRCASATSATRTTASTSSRNS
jgi:beta-galactosidase/beta-glucuronidase